MEEYGGLLRRMPWTGSFFLIGAVSISALPPTNGFVSEWLVFQSLFLSFQIPTVFLKLMLPIAAAILALTGVLALACFAKAFGISFLALPRSAHARHAQEVPVPMRIAMGLLATFCVALGIAPMVVVPLLDRVVAPLAGISIASKVLAIDGWALAPVNVEFSSLSTPVLGAAAGSAGDAGVGACRRVRWSSKKHVITRPGAAGSTSRPGWNTLRPALSSRSNESSVRFISRRSNSRRSFLMSRDTSPNDDTLNSTLNRYLRNISTIPWWRSSRRWPTV